MDALLRLIERLYGPLLFASGDDYARVSLVKDMEKSMASLIEMVREAIGHLPSPALKSDLTEISRQFKKLFKGYDSFAVEQKMERVADAIDLVHKMQSLLLLSPLTPPAADQPLIAQDSKDLLSHPLQEIRGVGPRMAALLARKNLSCIEDFLYFLPRRYEDRRTVSRIYETIPDVKQTVVGKITQTEMRYYGRRKIFEVTVDDGHGILMAKWFKGRESFLRATFKLDRRIILTGLVSGHPFGREMIHPDFEILDEHDDQLLHFKRIVPVYSETEGLSSKTIRRMMWHTVRDYAHLLQSPIPESLCKKRQLIDILPALRQIHFPSPDQDIQFYQEHRSDAHRRLIYDEFFFFQLGMALRRQRENIQQGISFRRGGELLKSFYTALSFDLTAAQQRVIMEIEKDMTSVRCMNRLLQGDVGSGKTVVSMAAMVIACENGYQAAMMAPTEILAGQHYRNLRTWSEKIGLRIGLLTGSCNKAKKMEFTQLLREGEIDIAVGTLALIQEEVRFKNLGIAIIDEQHRFGVLQRGTLRKKGTRPDMLVMTATPIPRTLAMTAYGDLDVSVIDEMPPGKEEVSTRVLTEKQRPRLYALIRSEINKGNQIFIVYPLVEETENLCLKDAKGMAEHLQREIFPDIQVGLIHGRMNQSEKERVMDAFIRKQTGILVSTTVIEVGIDIPAASLMVIEHAERFGLSQLHQLRGRVGRGTTASACILMTQHTRSDEAQKRLRIMEQTNDGFRIAEEDLSIRGPGEFLGTRQSGFPAFRVADIARDIQLLSEAREDAFALAQADPSLEGRDHLPLREALKKKDGETGWLRQKSDDQ